MASLVKGIHHITVCASTAQKDVDFFTKVVGQRLIKQTVLFDGRYAHYHLYYATRADFKRRRVEDADQDYRRALELVTNESERRFLERRMGG